ncbi:MAG: trypsin-like peptidase domain-containing protein, partial [Firmicutes bacterium]|nr:trypsin-like peptidase domain-containing protein [Bacillota bacterium]
MENWNSDQYNPEQKADAFVNGQNGQNAAEQNTAANTPEGQNAGAQNQTQPDGAYSYGPRQAPTGGNPYDTQAGNVGGAYRPTYQQPDYYGYSGTYTGHAYTQPPKAKAHKKNKAKIWVPIVIVAAMLVGVAGGFGINELVSRRKADTQTEVQSQTERNGATEAKTEETQGSGDLSHKVTTAPTTGALTPSEIYSKYVNAVVGIANEGTTTNYFGQVSATASSGTGFIITEDGYILTNHHVVEGAKTLTVTLNDGTEYPATLVGSESAISDVALLKIDATGLTTVDIGDSDSLQVGEEVCTIGNPLGELTNTLTVGYISAKDREINTDGTPINMMQTDAAINSGNSGGPLFDMNGNVVGITTAKYSGETNSGTVIEGLGFA